MCQLQVPRTAALPSEGRDALGGGSDLIVLGRELRQVVIMLGERQPEAAQPLSSEFGGASCLPCPLVGVC